MLKRKVRNMVKEHGKAITKKIILEEISKLQEQIRKANDIYTAIDIEHSLLDYQSMLKWLNQKNV